MIRSILDALGFLECCKYNNEKDLLDLSQQQVKDLEKQITELLTQIQELKAINNYQCYNLEQKIVEMEKENCILKNQADSWKKKFFSKSKPKQNKPAEGKK